MSDRRYARWVTVLMAAGFGALLIAGLAVGAVIMRTQTQTWWVGHAYDVERNVSAIRLSLEQIRSARRAQVLGIEVAPDATYDAAMARLREQVARVTVLTRDNPVQQANIDLIHSRVDVLDALFSRSVRRGVVGSPAEETARQAAAAAVQQATRRMLEEEGRVLAKRTSERETSVIILYVVLAFTIVMLAVVAVGSLTIIRRYTRSLIASRNELASLNENLEAAVQVRTTDLQRANEEIQRFAYIVSHDLRSPLVNVMGFTAELDAAIKPMRALVERVEASAPELASADARLAVDEDLPEAVRFIRTSTQKMDRLINAILRLSREGRRTITPERINMRQVAENVVDALRHRIDELGVTVTVADDLPQLFTDRLAVEQILSNLVENAVKYLQPGRPGLIQISGQTRHGRAMIAVKDNGRGIEPRDHERVFDLFRRSGVQDQSGEGIGLAHVRALAYRMGGTIDLISELGKGSTFTINLPISFTGEKGAKK